MAFLRRLDDAKRDASRDVKLAAVDSANPEKGERSIVTSILQEWRNKKAAQQEALMADSKSRGPPPRGPSFRSDDAGSAEAAETTTTTTTSSAYAAGAEGDVDSWVRYVDEATGYPYYYNHATQESHWAAAEEAQAMDTDTATTTATAATFGASPSSYPSSSYSKYMTMSDVTATAGDDDDDGDRDGREPSLLDKCSEYLFDVFESNLTPEYQRINAIQELAIASFAASDLEARPDHKQVYEYTFAQQEYHRQFCDLFEKLLEEFLTAEGLSVEAFVARLEATVADRSGGKESKRQRQVAHEVIDCINWYASFDSWAESMREEARYRKRCEENHTPAVVAASAKASTSHRMDK